MDWVRPLNDDEMECEHNDDYEDEDGECSICRH